ncbi:hypothetical protein EVAR_13406_1 [Eumeta japonica]|uniref:Uncharacterized protein n=1 Tax=Eumeta variegata TaxID=151549 RepID=A0A4C1V7G8_EUMVA|nr:hypothetical protein EVAR_13406_1 [Eumeta japonica]
MRRPCGTPAGSCGKRMKSVLFMIATLQGPLRKHRAQTQRDAYSTLGATPPKVTPAKNHVAGSSLQTSLHWLWFGTHLHTQHTQMNTRDTGTLTALTEHGNETVPSGGRTNIEQ